MSTGETPRVRPVRPDDRPFILALAERLATVGTPPWRDAEQMRAFHRRYAEAAASASGDDEAAMIAEAPDGTRLGVVHIVAAHDALTGEPQAYVTTLAVAAAAEGTGVGRTLMVAAEEWARAGGFRIVALDVFAENQRARDFYALLGYHSETVKLVKELSEPSPYAPPDTV